MKTKVLMLVITLVLFAYSLPVTTIFAASSNFGSNALMQGMAIPAYGGALTKNATDGLDTTGIEMLGGSTNNYSVKAFTLPSPAYVDKVYMRARGSSTMYAILRFSDNTTETVGGTINATITDYYFDVRNVNKKVTGLDRIYADSGGSSWLYEFDLQRNVNITDPPSVPVLKTVNASHNQASLSWADAPFATGYNVYRNGVKVNTNPIGVTTYVAVGNTDNVTYSWQVTGINVMGESAKSNTITSFFDGTPSKPSLTQATAISSGKVTLQWAKTTNEYSGYNIYSGSTKMNKDPIDGLTYTLNGLEDNTTYQWSITALNGSIESVKSNVLTSYYDTVPSVPSLLKATAISPDKAILNWDAAKNVSGYHVYRDGKKITTTPITDITYTATGLKENVEYQWQISGVMGSVESAKSNSLSSNWDTIPPNKPTALFATPLEGKIQLEWVARPAAEGVKYYTIYQNGVKLINVTTTKAIVNAVFGVLNHYRITASDENNNESEQSDEASAKALEPPDTTPPAMPTGLKATGLEGKVMLSWKNNTESDLAGYFIYQNNVRLNAEPFKGNLFYVIGGMSWGVVYPFQISAVDFSGNESEKSDVERAYPIKPEDTTPPAKPSGFIARLSSDALKIVLSWDKNEEPDLAGYQLYFSDDNLVWSKVNGSLITETKFEYADIQGNSKYYFKLSAVDTSGNESPQTKALFFQTPTRDPNGSVEVTKPKLLVSWDAVQGAINYLIYYKGNLIEVTRPNVFTYEITAEQGYDPADPDQTVSVKARFLDGSIGSDPSGSSNTKWGFSASDVIASVMGIVSSLGIFVLLGLSIKFAPRIMVMIRNAVAGFKRRA